MSGIVDNIERVLIGKRYVIELTVVSLACGGHVLIDDVPGVGKTSLVSALARSLDCSFRRIQFTPDILPSDITGFSMFNQKTGEFEYREGAVMSQIILADEINRTSPKTQASLLEVMEENQVTVDGVTYKLPQPFMVLATQNPVEYLGTYPLPEAQLDRFFMKVTLGYPTFEEEQLMLLRFRADDPLKRLVSVAGVEELLSLRGEVERIYVDNKVSAYVVALVSNTRLDGDVVLGGSPRASLCLSKSAQAWALYNGRDYVLPDDVQRMAPHVLGHRIVLRQDARLRKITQGDIVMRALEKTRVPVA
jgi:MoxR-like ATPase